MAHTVQHFTYILSTFLILISGSQIETRNTTPILEGQSGTDEYASFQGPKADLLGKKLEHWLGVQRNRSAPVLVLRPKYGLGNQLLSLVSAFALALVTHRRLQVDWEAPFRGLLEPPFDWSPTTLVTATEGLVAVHFTAHSPLFPAAARALACGNMEELLPGWAVALEADQFFLPLILLSPQVSFAKTVSAVFCLIRTWLSRLVVKFCPSASTSEQVCMRLAAFGGNPTRHGRALAGSLSLGSTPQPRRRGRLQRSRRRASWPRCLRLWASGSYVPPGPSGPARPTAA